MVRAEFQKQDIETLVVNIDSLVDRILGLIKLDDHGRPNVDVDCLSDLLENFAGRDYIVHTKLKEGYLLLAADKEYIQELLEKRMA